MKPNTDKKDVNKTDDLEILEDLKREIYDAIKSNEPQPKVGDLLKVIELKRKLSVDGKGEKKFWDMVNKIRSEELNKPKKSTAIKKKPKGDS
ncbi:MAG: hypothetical protein GY865_00915 [candidate division Zixibacteria bacterium]|nr:hypothetical protein [candidate division Zixibacteria bacterium]